MTKRKTIITIILLVLAAFFIYAVSFKKAYQKEIIINASVPLTHQQISSIDKIQKWFLPFAETDTAANKIIADKELTNGASSLSITSIIGYSAQYAVTANSLPNQIHWEVFPDTAGASKVVVSYKASLWQQFFKAGYIAQSLSNLKDYMADTKKMYGYEIEMTSVTDTAFLFSDKIIAKQQKNAAFKTLYQSLIKYAEEQNFGYNGVRIFYMLPYGKDSIHLFNSIGITNTDNVPITGPFILKRMPYMGKLLMSYYQGSFANVIAPLNALGQYETDNDMKSMAIPFIKLVTEGIEFDDQQMIQAKALYPVY